MGSYVNATADEHHYVALKPLVESIGLKWETIRQLLNRSILGTTTCMVQAVAEDGKLRQMICLPLDKVEGFLFLINPNLYEGDVKQRLIAYQLECFNALHQYFTQGIAVNPYANMKRSELLRLLAEAEEDKERQQKMLEAKDDEIDGLNSRVYLQGEKIKALTERKDKLVLNILTKESKIAELSQYAPVREKQDGETMVCAHPRKLPKKKTVPQPCQQMQLPVTPQPPTISETVVSNPNVTVKDVSNPF
ncbi:MAG: phage antirepressor N-terminal domain-containing protein [Lentisphaeria bacterium]|nr:phage antirepressor N-terminal domain-containing protein [Lentisphaeria bacterium]